jgi:CheY-like chemotaxis protein
LDDFGFGHDIAGNGNIAIEKIRKKTYDIILMDLQMPEMNGFEATEYIRNTMKCKIPIIALTADVITTDLQKCKTAGMSDLISKPIDEKLLYHKMTDLLNEPAVLQNPSGKERGSLTLQPEKVKSCIDLAYLKERTKKNPSLMMDMLKLYLAQTPPLIDTLTRSLSDKDWDTLHTAVHKMIPSFSIIGISQKFEDMAQKIQEYTATRQRLDEIDELVWQLEKVCTQACEELTEEFHLIKNND